jgi:hypothetical protein
MESKTLHQSQCVNRFLYVKHKGNPPVNANEEMSSVGSRLPKDESRPRVQGRETTSCDFEIHL